MLNYKQLWKKTSKKGHTICKEKVRNVTNILYPVSPAMTITYDALNRATTMVDAVGTTAYT